MWYNFSYRIMFRGDAMRIILCDDDEQILDQLQKYLREYHEYAVYSNGDALLAPESRASAL